MSTLKGSDLRELIEWAKELGFTCEKTKRGHYAFRRPNTQPVFISSTPTCYRARLNIRKHFKHALRDALSPGK